MPDGKDEKKATFTSRVGSDGRITIPKATRELLEIEENDMVNATVQLAKKGQDNSEGDEDEG